MYLLHSRNSWYYSQGGNPAVEFCLWVLQVDGLLVPPFDQHPNGDGSLRALGLTADTWQTWFLRTLDAAQHDQDVEHLRQLHLAEYLTIAGEPDLDHLQQRYHAEQFNISDDPPLPPPPEWYHYQASWKGSSVITDKLIDLDQQFRQIADQNEQLLRPVERALRREERTAAFPLYDGLRPYHHRIPPLTITLVPYMAPLDYLVPPTTVLLTIQEDQPGFQEFHERVLAAVAALAARPQQQRRLSIAGRTL